LHTMEQSQLLMINLYHQSNVLHNGEYFVLTDKKGTLYKYDMCYINVWYNYCHPLLTNNHETDSYMLKRAFNSAKTDYQKMANFSFILRNISTEQLKILVCKSQLITDPKFKIAVELNTLGVWNIPISIIKLWSATLNKNLLNHALSFAN
jgi:hypothetical protein